MGRARQASPVPPAYDVRVAGSDLPIVAPTLWSAAQYVGLAWYTLLKMSLSTRLFNKYAYVAMLFVLRYVIKDPTSTESKPFAAFFRCWWMSFKNCRDEGKGKEGRKEEGEREKKRRREERRKGRGHTGLS